MIASMTGFARRELAGTFGTLTCELRSVNHRYLEPGFRLPEELRPLESDLRQLLTKNLKRGKVELRAALENTSQAGVADPSTRLLQRLNGAQDAIKSWLPQARDLSVADVLRLAGNEGATQGDWTDALAATTSRVLDDLIAARAREGERLATTLNERISQLRSLVAQAQPLVPQLVAQQLISNQPPNHSVTLRAALLTICTVGGPIGQPLFNAGKRSNSDHVAARSRQARLRDS